MWYGWKTYLLHKRKIIVNGSHAPAWERVTQILIFSMINTIQIFAKNNTFIYNEYI
jgi:hypothetical protein